VGGLCCWKVVAEWVNVRCFVCPVIRSSAGGRYQWGIELAVGKRQATGEAALVGRTPPPWG
jgi:hypothetical protein